MRIGWKILLVFETTRRSRGAPGRDSRPCRRGRADERRHRAEGRPVLRPARAGAGGADADRARASGAGRPEPGEQYKEIAASLGISINTVRRHIMAIYDKLHVNSRREAVGKLGRVEP